MPEDFSRKQNLRGSAAQIFFGPRGCKTFEKCAYIYACIPSFYGKKRPTRAKLYRANHVKKGKTGRREKGGKEREERRGREKRRRKEREKRREKRKGKEKRGGKKG